MSCDILKLIGIGDDWLGVGPRARLDLGFAVRTLWQDAQSCPTVRDASCSSNLIFLWIVSASFVMIDEIEADSYVFLFGCSTHIFVDPTFQHLKYTTVYSPY